MTRPTTNGTWPDRRQFDAHTATPGELDHWEDEARMNAWFLPLGAFNWPGAMRSLIAEVRHLRQGQEPK